MLIRNISAYARDWSPMGLALSCVLAAIALCLHVDNQLLFQLEIEGAAGLFAVAFVTGAAALCLAVAVTAHDQEQRRWSIGIGMATGAAGVAVALCAALLPPQVAAAGSGALLGFGLTCLLRQWGRCYRRFSFQGSLTATALSFFIASLLWFALVHAGTPFLFCLGLLVLVFCGGLPLLARNIVQADEARSGLLATDEPTWEPSTSIVQVMREGWAAVAGIMLGFFATGLGFWPEAGAPAGEVFVFKPVAYLVVTLVTWWVASHAHRPTGGILGAFYRVSLPVAALAMLTGPLVRAVAPGVFGSALATVAFAGVAVCNVLGLVVLFWTAKCTALGFSKVFAVFCASCAASMMAGLLASWLLGSAAQTLLTVLLLAYLAAMLLAEVRRAALRCRSGQGARTL